MKKAVFTITISIFVLLGCQTVVNKMAFHPDTKNVIPTNKLPENVKEIFIKTEDKIEIQTYFIPNKSSNKIVIYYHGNAGNIGHRLSDLMQISRFGVNVLGVGYRGYGKSQGSPTEEGIYIDGKSALKYATNELGFTLEQVYIFGRSIGTTVAINTAQRKNIAGLILVTPLTSGKDHAKASGLGLVSFLAGNSFNNIEKIPEIICPALIIHGNKDRVIPFEMGVKIYEDIKTEKKFVKIEGAGHNDISGTYKSIYWNSILEFIQK